MIDYVITQEEADRRWREVSNETRNEARNMLLSKHPGGDQCLFVGRAVISLVWQNKPISIKYIIKESERMSKESQVARDEFYRTSIGEGRC